MRAEDLLHPVGHARTSPGKSAIVMTGSGESLSYAALDGRAARGAHLIRLLGVRPGGGLALMMGNRSAFLEIVWAAERTGTYLSCLSSRLTAAEAAYIVRDGDCGLLVLDRALAGIADALAALLPGVTLFMAGGSVPGWGDWDTALAEQPDAAVDEPRPGSIMLYSSGTTGVPKGVRLPLSGEAFGANTSALVALGQALYGFAPDMVYLSPAPLYHAAPLRWSMAVQQLGGTVAVMERFDAEAALAAVERYRVTHAQFVPTHFVRMLKLPAEVRARYDLSSLRAAWHAAAPCPLPVKRAMIEWLGPIVHEYYAGTEGNGFCAISAGEWLAREGSVGRNLTAVTRICGEDGEPLPPRTEGQVFFDGGPAFSYHKDPEKTAAATNRHGWTTLGDMGWVDEDGYLYLTDRRSFTIISGGVNVYPAEVENLLVTHPAVADAAVIGVPDDDLGEAVLAVVQPQDPAADRDALRDELTRFARQHLSHVKVPRRIDFRDALPRHDTGKLYKRELREEYRAASASGS